MSDTSSPDDDAPIRSLADPTTFRDDPAVAWTGETKTHARPEGDEDAPCLADTVGVGVTDADDRLLLLVSREHGVALLPHGEVETGDDWADVARRGVEGQTGIDVTLDGVPAVRDVEHRLEDDDEAFATTRRVVFVASPDGGAIQDCKRSADAGSDRWVADWYASLPSGVDPAPGGAGEDLRLFL